MTSEPETLHLGEFDRHGTTRAVVDGRWTEIEHGIPSERVVAEITGKKRRRGHIVDILDASPDRIEPPCVYFRDWACGGCQWQHIAYEAQVRFMLDGVRHALERHGLDIPVTATHVMDDPWRYRSTAGIALGRRAGFRRQASLAIVPIKDCPISHPVIGTLMARLNHDIEAEDVPDFHGRVRVEARLIRAQAGDALLALIEPDPELPAPPADLVILSRRLASYPEIAGVSVRRPGGAIHHDSGERFGWLEIAGKDVAVDAAAFFQTNLSLLPEMIRRVHAEARLPVGRVVDLYGGVGIFGLYLSDAAGEVTVVESNVAAVEAGRRTAESWGADNVRFIATDVERGLGAVDGADVVIVDPPRAGLSEPVRAGIIASAPPTVLYISCLPDSLARDLTGFLAAGYQVDALELFDFYPQTYHVELLAVLRCR